MKRNKWKRWLSGAMAFILAGTGFSGMQAMPAKAAGTPASYAEVFTSLYKDVIINGRGNGYLSDQKNSDSAYGVPYHAVETFVVDGVDQGHETTSEDVAYLVQAAAMRDTLVNAKKINGTTGELDKAWSTLESMIPGWSEVAGNEDVNFQKFWDVESFQADTVEEGDEPTNYPTMSPDVKAVNPMYPVFKQAYSSENGYYLMQSLADVDDWYGFGGRQMDTQPKGRLTYIKTHKRGAGESYFETVPSPCVERLQYGDKENGGMLGIVSKAQFWPKQYQFECAPAAEQRAIEAVYFANRNGVGKTESVSKKAGEMGDQLRNVMFDTYYKAIAKETTIHSNSREAAKSCHGLMGIHTEWGSGIEGSWGWQTSGSHIQLADQNPLSAYACVKDPDISNAMKATGALADYQESLKRQMEYYLWLQSKEGPIAGGCTNSFRGRYEVYPSGWPCFYDMIYVAHPAMTDPGCNESIRSQAVTIQRLAELYQTVKQEGEITGVKPGEMTIEQAADTLLTRWIKWFIANVKFDEKDKFGNTCAYLIPEKLDWGGSTNVPATWTGYYDPNGNRYLSAKITSYGQADVESVSAICNALICYAKAKEVDAKYATEEGTETAQKALYYANRLLTAQYREGRDDKGIAFTDSDAALARVFEEEVYIPPYYDGKMPDGSVLTNGATFSSIRSQYRKDPAYKEAEAYYAGEDRNGYSVSDKNGDGVIDMNDYTYKHHIFAAQCSAMTAYGTMALLYPNVKLTDGSEKKTYIVTFDLNGKGSNQTQTVVDGENAVVPSAPTAEGFTFGGWYTSSNCRDDEKYDFADPVTKTLVLYAKWSAVSETPAEDPKSGMGDKPATRPEEKKTTAPESKGTIIEDGKSGGVYVVTSNPVGEPTVEYKKQMSAGEKSVVIPDTIVKNAITYQVTSIAANACKKQKKLTKVVIGKNVKKIGKNAFNGCKSLKRITIKTTMLQKSGVGRNAFKGIHAKATAKVQKEKLKSYTAILKARGMKGKQQKIKK